MDVQLEDWSSLSVTWSGPRLPLRHPGPRIHEQKNRTDNSIRETNGNFGSCNSCKRLVSSRLHELHDSKFPLISRMEFIRSKLSNFSAHVSRVRESHLTGGGARLERDENAGTGAGREGEMPGRICRSVCL